VVFSGVAQSWAQKPKREFQLHADSADFWKLFDKDAKLATVGTGFGFTEGPVWDPAGFVYVSDEETNKIFRLYADGRKEELVSLGDPDGNTYDRELRLIDCASELRAIIRLDRNGKYEVLASEFERKKFNSPNDVVTGPDGALYFTDPTLDLPEGQKQEIPFQGVYRLDPSGAVTLLTRSFRSRMGWHFRRMARSSTWMTASSETFGCLSSRLITRWRMARFLEKSLGEKVTAYQTA